MVLQGTGAFPLEVSGKPSPEHEGFGSDSPDMPPALAGIGNAVGIGVDAILRTRMDPEARLASEEERLAKVRLELGKEVLTMAEAYPRQVVDKHGNRILID